MSFTKRERGVDALVVDAPAAIDDPRLVDLVLGEAVRIEQARAEVAVDHAHRRVAEHEDEDAAAADLGGDLARDARRAPARRGAW